MDVGHAIEEIIGRNLVRNVRRTQLFGKALRIWKLAVLLFLVAHGKRADARAAVEHALHHKARIHARTQKAADLNIGNLVRAHGIREHFLYAIGPFVKRKRFVNLVLKLIVARRFERARGKIPCEPTGRLQLIHAFEQGFLVGNILIRQVIRNFFAHNFLHETRMIQKALDFRAEQELPVFVVVVEGLDAEDVARAEQLARLRVPNDKREHAAQLIKHAATPFLVAMKDGLGVGMRGKRVTRRQ